MCLGGNDPQPTTAAPPPPSPPPPPPTLQNPAVVNKDNPSSLSSQARFRNSLRIDLGGLAAPAAANGPGSLFINPAAPPSGQTFSPSSPSSPVVAKQKFSGFRQSSLADSTSSV